MDLNLKVGADVGEATQGLAELKKDINLLKQELLNANREFKQVSEELSKVQKTTPGASAKISELQSKLKELAAAQLLATAGIKEGNKQLKAAEGASGGFSKGLSSAYGGLSKIAQIIPGLGIGGLIGLIAGPLVDALEELFNKSNQASESLQKTFSESGASVAGNVARLQALVSIAQDVTKSDQARKEALGALNKEYDGFNGKLTLANINTKAATDLIDKQTTALIRQAQIKGVQDLITEETKKQAENARKDLSDNLDGLQTLRNKIISILGAASGGGGIAQGDAIVSGLKNRDKQLKESAQNIDAYKTALKNLLVDEADAGTLFKEPKLKVVKEKIKKALKFGKEDLSKLFFDEDAIQLKLPASVELDFKKSLRGDPFASEGLGGILSPEALDELKMQGELLGMGVTKGMQDGLETGVSGLRFPKLKALYESSKEQLKDLNDTITSTLQSTLTDAISNMAENLGSGKNLFSGFTKILGDGLKSLGKYMISVSAIVKGLKAAISSLNPVLLFAGGIALVAIGAALSKQSVPGFAAGVKNFGGGYALVGERGREIVRLPKGSDVIPNHKLDGIGSAEPVVLVPEFRIKGNDLHVIMARTSNTISRNG